MKVLELTNILNEHGRKEVMNLIRYKNEYKYQQLQQRIDKAIEYIQDNDIYLCKLSENKIVNNDKFAEISIFPKIELLDILKGEDNDNN